MLASKRPSASVEKRRKLEKPRKPESGKAGARGGSEKATSSRARATTGARSAAAPPKRSRASGGGHARSRTRTVELRPMRAAQGATPEPDAANALTTRMDSRFDARRLLGYVEAARRGDAHEILGVARDLPIREALVAPPPWEKGSYEKLLALYLATDAFGHQDLSGVIYDFAEHTYFRFDDEGYALAQVNADLGYIHAVPQLGLFDEERSARYYRAALAGPYPQGVQEELDALFATAAAPLPLLQSVRHEPVT